MSLCCNVLHDGAHFALFSKNANLNEMCARISAAMGLLKYELWMKNHSFRHHTFI